MTGGRFLALIGDAAPRSAITARVVHALGFKTLVETPRVSVLASADLSHIALGSDNVVLGPLHTYGKPGALTALTPGATETIVATRGQHLVDRYWGGYIAILSRGDEIDVVRAPFGWLPCLYAATPELAVAGSDVAALLATGLVRAQCDGDALARHLLAPDIRREDTCLRGISELRGGDRLEWGRTPATVHLWSPWPFAAPARQIADRADAIRRLRDETLYVVRERTHAAERALVLMSGGLDSSILAACLRQLNRDTIGLTFVTDNPSGDERRQTRRVTDHLEMPLLDALCAVADVDIQRSAAAHLARPAARSFAQGTRVLTARAAVSAGTARVLDGGAGDNIFCSIQSPAPVADCLLLPDGRPHFWPTARVIAELAQASVWTVARRGWLRARSRRPYRREPEPQFLSSDTRSHSETALDHPWLHAPGGIPPGKSVHVGLLAPAQGLIEDHDPFDALAADHILVSQPLIELCLQITTWDWFDRGCNRAAARHAFAGALPEDTIWRRSKGTPDSYLVEILDANRPTIRTMLNDGMLAAMGLLDRDAVAAELDDPRPSRGHTFARLMTLVDAEAWARAQPG